MVKPINFQNKLSLFAEPWTPKVIAEMNDYQFKLAKLEGEFIWHKHDDTDETFIVLSGQMYIEFRTHTIPLNAGEMIVVPKGVEHKPGTHSSCEVLLIEPRGVINTGDEKASLTAANDVWL